MYVTLGLWGASLETHSSVVPQQTLTKLLNVTIWPQKQWNWSLPMKLKAEIWSSHCSLLHNSLSLLQTALSWSGGGTHLPALHLPHIPDTLKTSYLSEAHPKGVKPQDHSLQEHSKKRSLISKTQITQQVLRLPAMSSTPWERDRAIAEWRIKEATHGIQHLRNF